SRYLTMAPTYRDTSRPGGVGPSKETTMTLTTAPSATTAPVPSDLAPIVVDLYRDIHKGIRAELFAATLEAGRLDPADDAGRAGLDAQVNGLVRFLVQHAEHEDG